MNIHLKYFGQIAEHIGRRQEQISVSIDLTTEQLITLLSSKYKGFDSQLFILAVNQSMVVKKIVLKEGDEVAVLPPFSGG